MALYTNYRIKHLELDALLDFVYTPKNHDIPENLDPAKMSLFPVIPYDLRHAEHRYTAPGAFKPSTTVLMGIVEDLGVQRYDCVYVGDSLMKDVAMANDAAMTSIHAAYGQANEREQYELLKAVTHWSEQDVLREATYKRGTASHTLHAVFEEIFEIVDPQPYS
jgi:phosphoglycolate phosphatase-like HAD superfamily hydrolase